MLKALNGNGNLDENVERSTFLLRQKVASYSAAVHDLYMDNSQLLNSASHTDRNSTLKLKSVGNFPYIWVKEKTLKSDRPVLFHPLQIRKGCLSQV